MNYGIYCNTVYQLFAAMCFTIEYVDKETDSIDLYIDIDNAIDLESYAAQLKRHTLFTRIYDVERICSKETGIQQWKDKLLFYFNPRKALRSSIKPADIPDADFYDVTMVSYLGPLPRVFIYSFPNAKTYLFEDGLGSYLSSQHYAFATRKDKVFQALTGRGEDKIKIENRFLFCPEFYSGEYNVSRITVPQSGTEAFAVLESLFPADASELYSNHQIIYLTQPIESTNVELVRQAHMIERTIETKLEERFSDNVLVRPHPRQFDKDYGALTVDKRRLSWELSCSIKTSENSLLIALFSTAQIIPKILYNKEPYLMFLYKMFPENLAGTYNEIENSILRLKSVYFQKERILIPESVSEMESMISQIICG